MVKQSEPQFHRQHQRQESTNSAERYSFMESGFSPPAPRADVQLSQSRQTSAAGDESSIAKIQVDPDLPCSL